LKGFGEVKEADSTCFGQSADRSSDAAVFPEGSAAYDVDKRVLSTAFNLSASPKDIKKDIDSMDSAKKPQNKDSAAEGASSPNVVVKAGAAVLKVGSSVGCLRFLDTPIDDLGRVLTGEHADRAAMIYARNCILKASEGYDVLRLLQLEGDRDWSRRKWYMLYGSKQYKKFIFVAIVLHMLLIFVEAPVIQNFTPGLARKIIDSEKGLILVLEWAFLCIHLFDYGLLCFVQTSSPINALLTIKKRFFLLTVMCIGLIVRSATFYTTGCVRPTDSLDFNFPDCGVQGIPYTALLRPVLLVLRHRELLHSILHFMATFWFAQDVLTLMIVIVLVASSMGVALFYNARPGASTYPFADMPSSILTMYSFISTADNYTDIMLDPLGWSLSYSLYFILFSVLGLFLVAPLCISVFSDTYTQKHAAFLDAEKQRREMGSVTGFLLLDKGKKGALSVNTVTTFFTDVCKTSTRFVIDQVVVEDAMWDQPVIDVSMFRLLVSRLEARFLTEDSTSSAEGQNLDETRSMYGDTIDAAYRARVMLTHPLYNQFVVCVTLFRMWLCFQYGILSNSFLDTAGLVLMLFTVLEVVYRVLAFSWSGFWIANNQLYTQTANRFDFWLAVVTMLGYFYSRYTNTSGHFVLGFNQTAHDPSRVVLALPLLRLLTSVDSLRVKVLGLLYTLPLFSEVVMQLLCLFYTYGVLGCLMLPRAFALSSDYQLTETVFDSFFQSQITLYQLLLGVGWTGVMDSALTTTGSSVLYVLYFTSFILICGLLFSNLISGVVIVALGVVLETHAKFGERGEPTTFDLLNTLRSGVCSVADVVAEEVRLRHAQHCFLHHPNLFDTHPNFVRAWTLTHV
jgi:hypothetical protein